jgi:hypothetical protein
MKLQVTTTMKTNVKRLAVLTLVGAATIGLSACGGGGDSSDVPPDEQGGKIVMNQMNHGAAMIDMEISNDARVPTSTLFYTFTNDDAYQVYDGVSNTDWCTPTTCPNVCKDGQALDRVTSCHIYINAKNTIGYGESKTINDFLTITNGAKVSKYNLSTTGYLYAMIEYYGGGSLMSMVFAKSSTDNTWSTTLVNPTPTSNADLFSSLSISPYGTQFFGDANLSDLYYGNKANSSGAANTIDATSTGINPIKAITFDQQGRVIVGGFGSNQLWRYENGTWTSIASIPSLVDITQIATDSQGHIYLQGASGSGNAIYTNVSGSFQSIGQPSGVLSESSGIVVDQNDVVHVAFIDQSKTFKYESNAWTAESDVNANADHIKALSIDVKGNMFASAGSDNNIYEKTPTSSWTVINPVVSSDKLNRIRLANGSLLKITTV